jgi:pyruvate dehydrogenase E2 component (dihydrolipoamide acetyltransferase)
MTMGTLVTVTVPDLGDFKGVEVIEVLVKVGDEVAVDGALATLETEKATMDVPSTAAGRVVAVHLAKGARVSSGDAVVDVEAVAAAPVPHTTTVPIAQTEPPRAPPPPPPPPPPVPTPAPPRAAPPPVAPGAPGVGVTPVESAGFSRSHASPSVRLLARELGIDLARVAGSGPKGRVLHADVKAWAKRALAAPESAAGAPAAGLPRVPQVDFAKFGPIDVQPLTRVQRISGPRLHASWVSVPHVTQFDEADITALEAVRASLKERALAGGVKLTPLAFILRALARVLQQFPRFNASLDAAGENLVFKKYLHLGFAADTPNGLVVPVIRDADRKDVYELARELAQLSEKARAGKLTGAEMQGGCFTVSSLGGIGGTAFTPIINAPEVAILGVSRSSLKPVHQDGAFVPRLMLPLSLSYDHRVIDGADGARFTTALVAALGDPRALVEAVP